MKKKDPGSSKKEVQKEVSAGGLVMRDGEVLLVKVENLMGRVVWTFPKGHLELGETAVQAALREVREETGWECKIAGQGAPDAPAKPFMVSRYFFQRERRLVSKEVYWYLMDPVSKVGESDPEEILEARWFPEPEARDILQYKSDLDLLSRLQKTRGLAD